MKFNSYLFILFFTISNFALAQQQDSIRISGVVLSADSLKQIPNAGISRNDVLTRFQADSAGFFSIFAYPSDTIIFSSLGYNTAKFIVPQSLNSGSYSLVETLLPDSLDMKRVKLHPMPPAEEFVNAFKDQSLLYTDTDKYEAMRQNIELIDEMEDEELFLSKYQPVDINFGYGRLYNNSYGPIPGNNFLNPIRWSNFVNDLQELNFNEENN